MSDLLFGGQELKLCTECGNPVESTVEFCPDCGASCKGSRLDRIRMRDDYGGRAAADSYNARPRVQESDDWEMPAREQPMREERYTKQQTQAEFDWEKSERDAYGVDKPVRRNYEERALPDDDYGWERPARRSYEERALPDDDYSRGRPARRSYEERPQQSDDYNWDRPVRKSYDERPQQSDDYDWERPARRSYEERPQQSDDYDWERPARRSYDVRPQQSDDYGRDRPARRSYGERPQTQDDYGWDDEDRNSQAAEKEEDRPLTHEEELAIINSFMPSVPYGQQSAASQYPMSQSRMPQYQMQQPDMNQTYENPKYMNMGGWLLFFTIGNMLIALNNVRTALDTIRGDLELLNNPEFLFYFGDVWRNALIIEMVGTVVVMAAVVFQLIAVVQVFTRNKLFLLFEQITYFTIILSAIIMFISLGTIGVGEFSEEMPEMIGGLIGNVVGLLLHTQYYCKSERVRVYMRSSEYMDKAIFAFR